MLSMRNSDGLRRITQRWTSPLWGLVLLAAASAGWHFAAAQEEEEAAAVGVRGILPMEAPRGLSREDWSILGGNWEKWGAETGELVARLFEDEQLDVPAQRALLAQLRSRLRVMDKALADPRYRSIHGSLLDLRSRLVRRVDLAEAVLDTLALDPAAARAARLERARRALASALDGLRQDLQRIPGGAAWLGYLRTERLAEAARDDAAAEREAATLAEVAGKFSRRGELPSPQREFFERPAFDRLEKAVRELHAALGPGAPADAETQRAGLAQLVEAVEEYEETRSVSAANRVRGQLKALEAVLPDGAGRVRDALRVHYLNYNLHVVASEGLLARFMGSSRQETAPVQDYVMDASVSGWQTTNTDVNVDLRPHDDGARFAITLRGATLSNTTGVTSQATVQTQGHHQFWGDKEILFDGDRFSTLPAQVFAQPNNQTVGARTRYSWIPLLGSIADGIAYREAQRRRPQSNAHTARRMIERAQPEFNSQVDQEFAELNAELSAMNDRLREARVFPETRKYRSTDHHLQFSARVREAGELGGSRYNHTLTPGAGMTLHVQESLINNVFDRMNIAGRTMTERELVAEFERFLSLIAGRKVELGERDEQAEEDPSQFVFTETDPLRVRFEDGAVALTIRAGLKRPGEEDIPPQEVTVPLTYTLEGDKIVVTRGTVSVAAVDRPPSLTVQVVRAGVMRDRIQRAIPERTRDRKVVVEQENGPPVPLFVTQIEPRGGWLTLSLR